MVRHLPGCGRWHAAAPPKSRADLRPHHAPRDLAGPEAAVAKTSGVAYSVHLSTGRPAHAAARAGRRLTAMAAGLETTEPAPSVVLCVLLFCDKVVL